MHTCFAGILSLHERIFPLVEMVRVAGPEAIDREAIDRKSTACRAIAHKAIARKAIDKG